MASNSCQLATGKRFHSEKWQILPLNQGIINKVHDFAEQEKEPIIPNKVPILNGSRVMKRLMILTRLRQKALKLKMQSNKMEFHTKSVRTFLHNFSWLERTP